MYITLYVKSKSQNPVIPISIYFLNVHFLSLLMNFKVCEEIDLQCV